MPDEQTPPAGEKEQGKTPPAPEATPEKGKEGEQTPPPTKEDEKEKALAAKEKELKEREARITKKEQKLKRKGKQEKPVKKQTPSFTFDKGDEDEEEDDDAKTEALNQREHEIRVGEELLKVNKGVTKLLAKSKYKDVLGSQSTLAAQLESDPTGLYIFAGDAPDDADDAIERIEEHLDELAEKAGKKKEKKKEGEEGGEGDDPSKPAPTNPPEDKGKKIETPGERVSQTDKVGDKITDKLLGKK